MSKKKVSIVSQSIGATFRVDRSVHAKLRADASASAALGHRLLWVDLELIDVNVDDDEFTLVSVQPTATLVARVPSALLISEIETAILRSALLDHSIPKAEALIIA